MQAGSTGRNLSDAGPIERFLPVCHGRQQVITEKTRDRHRRLLLLSEVDDLPDIFQAKFQLEAGGFELFIGNGGAVVLVDG